MGLIPLGRDGRSMLRPILPSHCSVAEAALMMMLMLARRVDRAREVFAERRIGEPVGMELAGEGPGSGFRAVENRRVGV